MSEVSSFVLADYLLFAFMLLICMGIGVYFGWAGRRQGDSQEFLTASRKLSALPVSLSLTASSMSSVTLLAIPAEVYIYGAMFVLVLFAYSFAIVITSEVFLPIFYRLDITSTFEYLEMRFNKATRLLGTVLFIIQTVMFTGVIIYAPALALNQVTGINLWAAIFSTASVCTLYCTMGGLKAVIWTDVFQSGIMLAGSLSVIIKSVIIKGGISNILSDSQQGGRLNIWDFDMNPLRRSTFWSLVVGGTIGWTYGYGVQQFQVQRYISCKSLTHARAALFINLLGLFAILITSVFVGLCLYSVYKHCDPWTEGLVSAPDQLMPYLVVDIMTSHPGLPGLYLAALFSGCLSTVSSCINALAAVTVEDLIKPHIRMSEKHLSLISKALSFFYGVACIAMAGMASIMGGMVEAVTIIASVVGGPLLGLFTLGIMCSFGNDKGGLSGLVSGVVVSSCLALGEHFAPPPPDMSRPLPLTTEGCNHTSSLNWTSTGWPTTVTPTTAAPANTSDALSWMEDNWQSPSYLYFSALGCLTSLTVGLGISLMTGGRRQTVAPRLMLRKEDMLSYHVFKAVKAYVKKTPKELKPNEETEMEQHKNENGANVGC